MQKEKKMPKPINTELFLRMLQHEVDSFEENAEFTVPELLPACIYNLLTTDEKGHLGKWFSNQRNKGAIIHCIKKTGKKNNPTIYIKTK